MPGDSNEHAASRRWAEAREEMVRWQVAARGVRDPRVLEAMRRVPRERFVSPAYRQDACEDQALPLCLGQTISQPYMVAYMTEQLDLHEGMKVLEVGTGSGYQCAVLASLGGSVHSVERLPELASRAERILRDLGFGAVKLHTGDGSLGLPAEAPFDRILVTAAGPAVPQALVEQLTMAGRLVIPVGNPGQQVVVRVDRLAGRTIETPGLACRFVKLLGRQGWAADDPEAAPGG